MMKERLQNGFAEDEEIYHPSCLTFAQLFEQRSIINKKCKILKTTTNFLYIMDGLISEKCIKDE